MFPLGLILVTPPHLPFGTGPGQPRPAAAAQRPGSAAPLAPRAAAAARRRQRRRAGAGGGGGGDGAAAAGANPKGRWGCEVRWGAGLKYRDTMGDTPSHHPF